MTGVSGPGLWFMRIVRFACLGHNQFAISAGLSREELQRSGVRHTQAEVMKWARGMPGPGQAGKFVVSRTAEAYDARV